MGGAGGRKISLATGAETEAGRPGGVFSDSTGEVNQDPS